MVVELRRTQNKQSTQASGIPYRVYIAVNGEGYGHSSRALAVARHFHRDAVIFGSYGYVRDRILAAGYECLDVGPEVKFFGQNGSFELSKTILKNSNWPLVISKHMREEAKIIKQYGATCVLSDCRAASIFAAAKLGLPSLYMTNQTEFGHFFQRRKYRESNGRVSVGRMSGSTRKRRESSRDSTKAFQEALLSGAAEPSVELAVKAVFREISEIIIADFPPPDTICLPMLSHKPAVMKLQRMVGPVVGWNPVEVIGQPRPSRGAYVVGSLGGHQYRLPLFNALVEAAYLLPDVQFQIFSSFRTESQPPNLRIADFTENPECYFKLADLVVTQAGHSSAMELLSLGKASILVPDYKQIEQEANAERMVELGVSTQIVYPELTGDLLAKRIRHHLQSRNYEFNAQRLSGLAVELDGARRVAEIVAEYAHRVMAY